MKQTPESVPPTASATTATALTNGEASSSIATPLIRDHTALAVELERTKTPGVVARAHLTEVRAALYERHRAGAGGIEIVHALTAAVDDLMRALYRYAEEATFAALLAAESTAGNRRARRLRATGT